MRGMERNDFFKEVNRVSLYDLKKAEVMIDTYNMLFGTDFFIRCNTVYYITPIEGTERSAMIDD